ncbi:MAG: hypothetical protein K1X28_09210 [Parachlamydiales bacterium]|nr:hypothetical protein [Parachlamydiales bacterium]
MWARICEILLGLWLFASHFLFTLHDWIDAACASMIIIFSALSFFETLNKMHLLQVLPAAVLLYVSYSLPSPHLPLTMQNYILVGLGLIMFAIIPSHASEPPRPWKKFLNKL